MAASSRAPQSTRRQRFHAHVSHQHETEVQRYGAHCSGARTGDVPLQFHTIIAEHVPGFANKLADQLSRKYLSGATTNSLKALEDAIEVKVPVRTLTYYLTLRAPV